MRAPPATIQTAVRRRLDALLARTARELERRDAAPLPPPRLVYYDDRLAAGQAMPPRDGETAGELRLNTVYLEDALAPMLEETVAHELAHLVVFHLRPRQRQAPHGHLWRTIMRDWYGVEPECTHAFDTDRVRARRQRRWLYACSCRQHWLTTVRHRRIEQGTLYCCRTCQAPLRRSRRSA